MLGSGLAARTELRLGVVAVVVVLDLPTYRVSVTGSRFDSSPSGCGEGAALGDGWLRTSRPSLTGLAWPGCDGRLPVGFAIDPLRLPGLS